MVLEVELKFLDIDEEEVDKKLRGLGAEKKYDGTVRSVYFHDDKKEFSVYNSRKKALRIRKVNGKSILTFKSMPEESDMKMKEEIEVEVSDFDETISIIENLGFESSESFYKERKHYELGEIHFEIEEIEGLPPYLEIETHSEEDMIEVCKDLGLDVSKGDKRIAMEIWPERFK